MGGNRVPPPPRDLNVQPFSEARAPELESLHAIVAGRVNHDFRECRGKRRRTTSYDTRIARKGRRRKKRKHDNGDGKEGLGDGKENLPRRKRRKREFRENLELGFVTSADGTKRLRTHLWHAKRFTMVKKWGFFLPLGLHGRGRGSRSILKWIKSGAVVHDASYCCPVQLEGTRESLFAVMKMVLVPSPSDALDEVSRQILFGVRQGSGLLYHVGAPSQFIAPVCYMWRPSAKDDIVVENGNSFHGYGFQEEGKRNIKRYQLWVWIHPSAFNEGFDALKAACLNQKNTSGVSLGCISLEGKLAKFEIMGFKALQVLQKFLHPLSESHGPTNSRLRECTNSKHYVTSQLQKSFVLEHAEHLPSHAVLSLEVHDPRQLQSEPDKPFSDSNTMNLDDDSSKVNPNQGDCLVHSTPNERRESVMALWMKPEDHGAFLADNKMLWISLDKVNPPIKESILCSERHKKRLKFFKMVTSNVVPSGSNNKESEATSCPVLLLKHNNQRKTFTWWSIVLPLSWAKSFWIPLVSSGVQAIGLRERRWIACDNGLPYFPFDFPDCKAYSLSMTLEAVASDQASELRPLSARPLRVPIPPPWDCVRSRIVKANEHEDMQSSKMHLCGIDFTRTSSLMDLGQDNCSVSSEGDVLPSIGYVARTCDAIQNIARGRSCFLRVLLHAIREGVFEGGAVVCAPIYGDISHWTSRSEEREKLQIPQSFVKSYFTERAPNKWELQVPDDPSMLKSYNHRWPIGFVTTGFVRGSLRPVAEALCEATFLARLRAQQWDDMPDKGRPNIFVLVRNLRSSAYRLALATVVLEQEEDDFEFF